MTKFKALCLLLPFIFVLSCSDAKQITGPTVTAVEYIEKLKIGGNLSSISHRAIKRTQTYIMIVSKKGKSEADKIVKIALNKSINNHQKQWDTNLAEAYLEVLTISEINSLYYNGSNSPYTKKQRSMQSKIGTSMKAKSGELLTTVISEALAKAFKSV
tara:strand:+ start:41 stop:514 length:474 start_codon:yes stop_codon:yes gene_type:complete